MMLSTILGWLIIGALVSVYINNDLKKKGAEKNLRILWIIMGFILGILGILVYWIMNPAKKNQ